GSRPRRSGFASGAASPSPLAIASVCPAGTAAAAPDNRNSASEAALHPTPTTPRALSAGSVGPGVIGALAVLAARLSDTPRGSSRILPDGSTCRSSSRRRLHGPSQPLPASPSQPPQSPIAQPSPPGG